jgi:hypothetical protein
MSKLKKVNTRVLCLVLALAALATVLTIAVPTPVAAEKCGLEFHYFSDASHTTEVGMRAYEPSACGCGLYGWGSITIHREIEDAFCL